MLKKVLHLWKDFYSGVCPTSISSVYETSLLIKMVRDTNNSVTLMFVKSVSRSVTLLHVLLIHRLISFSVPFLSECK